MLAFRDLPKFYRDNRAAAEQAFELYKAHCGGYPPARVPGMDTVIRMAWRLAHGKTPEQAAAREYLYRWDLAIKAPDQAMLPHNSTINPAASVFGTPHTIGL